MHMELAVFTVQLQLGFAEGFTVELPNVVLLLVQVLCVDVGYQIFLANYAFWPITNHHLLHEIADCKFVFIHLGLKSFDLLVLTIEFVLEDFALIVVCQFLALELKFGLYVDFGSWFALLAVDVYVLVANERPYLLLFVEPKHEKDRKDINYNADFDGEVVGFGLLCLITDRCCFIIFNFALLAL
jgi:hypothetical protein